MMDDEPHVVAKDGVLVFSGTATGDVGGDTYSSGRAPQESDSQNKKMKILSDYRYTVKRMAELGLTGGIIYDALIARVAQKSRVECLLTLDADDFIRIWPEGKSIIVTP